MKKLMLALLLSLAVPAMADLQIGVFAGVDAYGAPCELEVFAVWYDDMKKHPLNERVTVKYEGLHWDLAHPAVLNEQAGTVRFDHNFFQQVVATDTGASSLILKIDHDAEPHAPTGLVFIEDNYRDPSQSRKQVCGGLKLVK